jgi:hypothetical protein
MNAISPLYAGLIGLLFVALSLRVVLARYAARVSVGDGGDKVLFKAIRVQSNCAEYAPIGLILLALAEYQGLPGWGVHLLGSALLAGRLSHAYGLGSTPQVVLARQSGMYLTFGAVVGAAMANISLSLI